MRPGRLALVTVSTAYAVALVWAAAVLPARVPSHLDAAGRVDDWSSRTSLLVGMGLVGLLVLAGIPLLGRAATRGDGTLLNMPRATKDYWLAPERRAEFRVRFHDDLDGFSALTGALLLAVVVLMTWVGTSGRADLPGAVIPALVGAYVLATVAWTVRLLRAYRPPAG
ncbi:putative membrane protein [Nocardioides cavernae]|uniref:Putative membrane protein n=1 Tax=Nocardioides cavernae TaxID=1921566 RepID=A0A7Y9H295_9ACTN|nr:DUF1648 domain-containing protein [Nocardioides cavernae]NYE36634.1 putative membrane protein [Nocardioides cavernae]